MTAAGGAGPGTFAPGAMGHVAAQRAPGQAVAELLALPGVEERVVLSGRVGFLAFHGGLEGGTEIIASAAAAASGASYYAIVQPPSVRWHLPSHVVGAGASPALTAFLAHVDLAVAVHGYGRLDRPRELLLGGRSRALASHLGDSLRRRLPDCVVVDALERIPAEMRGLHPQNPVNRCRVGGVQLELPSAVRGASGRWADDNSSCVPDQRLIEALVDLASDPSLASAFGPLPCHAPVDGPIDHHPPAPGRLTADG